jgi:hypothetical protein
MMWFAVDRDDRIVELDPLLRHDAPAGTTTVNFQQVNAALVHRAIRAGEPLDLLRSGGARIYVSEQPVAGAEPFLEDPWVFFGGPQPEGTRAVGLSDMERLRKHALLRFRITRDGTYEKIEGAGAVRASELPGDLVARLTRLSIAAADVQRARVDDLGLVLPPVAQPEPSPVGPRPAGAPDPDLLSPDVVGRRVAAAMVAALYERDPDGAWMGRLSLSPRVQGWLEAVQDDEPRQIVLIGLEAGPTLRSADPAVTRPIVAEWRALIAELERVGGPMPKLHELVASFEKNIPR